MGFLRTKNKTQITLNNKTPWVLKETAASTLPIGKQILHGSPKENKISKKRCDVLICYCSWNKAKKIAPIIMEQNSSFKERYILKIY